MSDLYVYRLRVKLPDGEPTEEQRKVAFRYAGYYPDDRPWRWPRRRHYFSTDAAQRRANMLRQLGCDVKIEVARIENWKEFA